MGKQPVHVGGLASWHWDFTAIDDTRPDEDTDVDDIAAAWGAQATPGHDSGDHSGESRLYTPKHFDTPIRIEHKRWLEEAGFRGHAQAVLHMCEQTKWDRQARLAWHGSVEDPLMVVIVWLLAETKRTGINPAAETGHWPDAKDYVCSKARWAITDAMRHEAPTRPKRETAKDGKRYWRKEIEISPVSPQITESDEPDEYIVPPWDIENVRGRPHNVPAPAWTMPGAKYERGAELLEVRRELLAILVKLVRDRVAESDPAASKVYEAMLVNHWTVRETARETGVSRTTIERAVERFKREWEDVTANWTWR